MLDLQRLKHALQGLFFDTDGSESKGIFTSAKFSFNVQGLTSLVPNLITFTGLLCAFSAVILAMQENLTLSGILILVGCLLDTMDGALARRLGITSDFGLQLDSLVDIVTFSVAPSVLVYQHLQQLALSPAITWGVFAGYMVGGVFRLARFNLLPPKKSNSDSVGLAIPMSAATLVLSVLSNRAYDHRLIPAGIFPVLVVLLTLLMVSRVRYPALASILRQRWLILAGLGVVTVLMIWLSPQLVGFGLTGGYISFGLVRSAYKLVRSVITWA